MRCLVIRVFTSFALLFAALLFAAKFGGDKLVEYLLDNGANINQRSAAGEFALILAVRARNDKLVKLLLERKADATLRNGKGESALDIAPPRRDSEIESMLRFAATAAPPAAPPAPAPRVEIPSTSATLPSVLQLDAALSSNPAQSHAGADKDNENERKPKRRAAPQQVRTASPVQVCSLSR